MGAMEIEQFLNFLANEKNVSASTQNQALCALVFLYREVLEQDFDQLKNLEWVKLPSKLPLVLTKQETWKILNLIEGKNYLMAAILYGTGMRLMEWITPFQQTPKPVWDSMAFG